MSMRSSTVGARRAAQEAASKSGFDMCVAVDAFREPEALLVVANGLSARNGAERPQRELWAQFCC
eukprot:13949221-Alexandrium_andersonii.AAC.1